MSGDNFRKAWRIIGGGVAVAALATGVYLATLQITGNFHAVVEGELYRSAQPGPADIVRYAQDHGIKTIINLRGENKGSAWYDTEIAQSQKFGIHHVDFRMSAWRQLPQQEAAELILLLERAEKPVLIHCKSGADRSGLAAALYVAAVAKLGEEAAERQISIRYGHFSIPLIAPFAMDATFEALEPWLGFPDS